MNRRTMHCLIAFVLLASSAAGQNAPAPVELPIDISASELQSRSLEAVGGAQALSRLQSSISRGTVEIAGLEQTGTYEMHEKAPAKTLTRVSLGGVEMLEGCDGKAAWEKNGNDVKTLEGAELQQALADCVFLAYLDWRRTYK